MSPFEIIKIVVVSTIVVVVSRILLREIKRYLNQRAIRKNLEKEKIITFVEMTDFCRFLLWVATIFNILGVILLFNDWNAYTLQPAAMISVPAALAAIIIIFKRHISKGRYIAIINFIFGLFLLFFNYLLVGLILLVLKFLIPPGDFV